ncbi:MAG: hypothetical protein IPO08_23495 [Xanthomonadales bacterium]|nr:hypothetical protein [Xanthomonadales bacterium]
MNNHDEECWHAIRADMLERIDKIQQQKIALLEQDLRGMRRFVFVLLVSCAVQAYFLLRA